jgi:hypothetical protein
VSSFESDVASAFREFGLNQTWQTRIPKWAGVFRCALVARLTSEPLRGIRLSIYPLATRIEREMDIADAELTARIGDTPLVALPSPNSRVAIYGKLEGNTGQAGDRGGMT